ncbi:MAG: hypothetical protein OQL19_16610 [Gammaproteobacteria bacterium]|nr:hypothetical protein [Gammaproteobacteria bacterium]
MRLQITRRDNKAIAYPGELVEITYAVTIGHATTVHIKLQRNKTEIKDIVCYGHGNDPIEKVSFKCQH